MHTPASCRFPAILHAMTFAILLTAPAPAQGPLTATQVLSNVRKEYGRIDDYVADVHVVVDVPNMKAPPMDATIYFKKPDKVHIDASGFAMLPRDVVGFNPSIFSEELYDAVLQGEETVGGARCLKLKLLAKSDTLRIQRAMLHVDAQRWIILRMSTDPLQGNSAEVSFTYALIDGKYHLPATVTLQMMVPSNFGFRGGARKFDSGKDTERKSARVMLTYKNHKVNKGINDAVFTRERKD